MSPTIWAGPTSRADSVGTLIDRDYSDHTVVCTAYVGAVALAIDVFHQHTVAGPKGPLLTIARRNLEVTVQADQELPLGWISSQHLH